MRNDLQKKIRKAVCQLVMDQPFFGTLVLNLENLEGPVETAATDGKRIFWNSEFLDSLTPDELKGVLCHEVMHCSNGHMWRRDSREPLRWNIAGDMAINPIILEAGLVLPRGHLLPSGDMKDKSAEEIYSNLPESEQEQGGGSGGGDGEGSDGDSEKQGGGQEGQGKGKGQAKDPGKCGGVMDSPAKEQGQMKEDWKIKTAQAAMVAKSQGKLPGSLQRMVDELLNPKVSWETLLRDFVERTAKNDYNWTRPNARHLGRGIILPSLVSDQLPDIVIVVDTSGSIGQKELNEFSAEVSAVLGAYDTTIHIVYADAAVAHTEVVTRADLPIQLKPHGGGGTDFRPAFDWIAKEGIDPACAIYLTDMYGTFPTQAPEYPVLWIATTDIVAPWGDTVKM